MRRGNAFSASNVACGLCITGRMSAHLPCRRRVAALFSSSAWQPAFIATIAQNEACSEAGNDSVPADMIDTVVEHARVPFHPAMGFERMRSNAEYQLRRNT